MIKGPSTSLAAGAANRGRHGFRINGKCHRSDT